MSDPAVLAGYRRALARAGRLVTIERWIGQPPNRVLSAGAEVKAIVRDYTPDGQVVGQSGYGAGRPGAITEGDRFVLMLEDDLKAKRFPLPLQKHDKVRLAPDILLDVVLVDPYKRAVAGAIELKAAGVQ